MDVQKVQIHDLGASGFIPSLGSKICSTGQKDYSSGEKNLQIPLDTPEVSIIL